MMIWLNFTFLRLTVGAFLTINRMMEKMYTEKQIKEIEEQANAAGRKEAFKFVLDVLDGYHPAIIAWCEAECALVKRKVDSLRGT